MTTASVESSSFISKSKEFAQRHPKVIAAAIGILVLATAGCSQSETDEDTPNKAAISTANPDTTQVNTDIPTVSFEEAKSTFENWGDGTIAVNLAIDLVEKNDKASFEYLGICEDELKINIENNLEEVQFLESNREKYNNDPVFNDTSYFDVSINHNLAYNAVLNEMLDKGLFGQSCQPSTPGATIEENGSILSSTNFFSGTGEGITVESLESRGYCSEDQLESLFNSQLKTSLDSASDSVESDPSTSTFMVALAEFDKKQGLDNWSEFYKEYGSNTC